MRPNQHSHNATARIEPRVTGLQFDRVPRHWLGGDAVLTRWFDALQITFPDGERFFIEAVRNFADRIDDAQLRADVRAFMRQEGQHGIVHTRFNEQLRRQGVEVDHILNLVQGEIRFHQRRFSKKFQLAMTAAFEHFTAMMGEGFMEPSSGLFDAADPAMRALLLWHAVEEIEHKAVAYDVYTNVAGGGYLTRVAAMLFCTFLIMTGTLAVQSHMLEVDGVGGRKRLRGYWRLFGWNGVMSRLLPRWAAWFKPGFHPWNSGIPPMARTWQRAWQQAGDVTIAAERVAEQYPTTASHAA